MPHFSSIPLRKAVEAGASGVLLKSDPLSTIVAVIRRAVTGEFCCSGPLAHALLHDPAAIAELSDRQVDVLRALDEGLDYRAAARVLDISEGAVKTIWHEYERSTPATASNQPTDTT